MTLSYEGKFAKERFMKKILLTMAALSCALFMGCQNTTENVGDGNKDDGKKSNPSDLPANTISFKLNGNPVTISNALYEASAGSTRMGKEPQGQYIFAGTATVVTGVYDKNTAPSFHLFYAQNGVPHVSNAGTANSSFNVLATATEITGTFSGTVQKTTQPGNVTEIVPVTDGMFRITK
jgi:predicted small secreted protein